MRVVYISMLNENTRGMYEYMCDQQFQVQLCDFSNNSVRKIIKFYKPDIVFVDNEELVSESFYSQLLFEVESTPVLILCNEEDKKRMKSAWEEFDTLVRPVNYEMVVNKMNQIMESESMLDVIFSSYKQEYGALFEKTQKTIMAIDDNPLVLRNIKSILGEDYNVLIAPSVEVAYKQLEKSGDVDLFILDYEMPEIDGVEAIQMFKQSKNYRDIPVIFLTGVIERSKIVKAVSQNPAAYLLKPVDADKLKQAVEGVFAS